MQSPVENSRYADDEIDLFELAQLIWQEKITVILVTFVVTALALAYAIATTPVYEVKAIVKPAPTKDLDELNISGLYQLTPEEALIAVGASLESYETRLGFLRQNRDLFTSLDREGRALEQTFEAFYGNSIKLLKSDAKKEEDFAKYAGISLQYPKGVDGVTIANGLVEYAIALEKERISQGMSTLANNRIEQLNRKLQNMRAAYDVIKEAEIAKLLEKDQLKKARLENELAAIKVELKTLRENRIQQLNEAIVIAKQLGIQKPVTGASLASLSAHSNVGLPEVNNDQTPLYFLGVEALTAEKTALEQRENDDFTSNRIAEINKELKLLESNRKVESVLTLENDELFVAELVAIHAELAKLKSIEINWDNVKLVRFDQLAVTPSSAIKPKKSLIVAMGVLLGGMLGVFIALTKATIRKRKLNLA